ncbi:PREDICTED: uncharacterized protein LOC108772485 [Cyphomyrmex costatus]|uniref:uncharacterized protein LOC108772485 n=1 Tax=Cyphomyrmex costatus TaxID=456900 RepID=UPI0008524191|nr:PREDICTED: uncharacterized protein LOC108772485 [Cyphomyrmex costatus]
MKKEEEQSENIFKELDTPITTEHLNMAISLANNNSAPGLDRISNNMLDYLPSEYRELLVDLFNSFLQEGVIPTEWRSSLVIFIPKAVFLDITGAFDNILPSAVLDELKDAGVPATIRKFIENLIVERSVQFLEQGNLGEKRISYKGTPQGSVLSPLLFNIALCKIGSWKPALGISCEERKGSSQHHLYSHGAVWWGSHPHCLLTIYRSVFRGAIEYACSIFTWKGNAGVFHQLERLQYKAIRLSMGYRLSTPINVMLCEAKEYPLRLRFNLLKSNDNEIIQSFNDRLQELDPSGLTVYTDGSRITEDGCAGAAFFSPELGHCFKYKLTRSASVFTAEAWAIYQALILTLDAGYSKIYIFSDSRSVLQVISSHRLINGNYIIHKIKQTLLQLEHNNIDCSLFWIPSHKGILGNELADKAAKEACVDGARGFFRTPYSDLQVQAVAKARVRFTDYLNDKAIHTGTHYHSLYFSSTTVKPWYFKKKLTRSEIVLINRLRSNHYNLNYSLFRKNMVPSPACECGDPRQDLNHTG